MAQLRDIAEEFGEINVWKTDEGTIRVKGTILTVPSEEGVRTGLAIDGSNSMNQEKSLYTGANKDPLFGSPGRGLIKGRPNKIDPVAKMLCNYLSDFSETGQTKCIYFACAARGAEIQILGDIGRDDTEREIFKTPKHMGGGTQLLPAINYYADTYKDSRWTIVVFITDGLIDDLDEVKMASKQICLEMASGERNFTKYVIIGMGEEFEADDSLASRALEELDDLDDDEEYAVEGQDLWDHKLAVDISSLDQIFAEVVNESFIVVPSAVVKDSSGNHVMREGGGTYSDGLPALFEFTMPSDSTSFTVELPDGNKITQDITEGLE